MKISVCIATYNGANYLKKQLDSIITQLDYDDEIIIVDDCSIDYTTELINEFKDNRVKLYKNTSNMGHVYSFGRAIAMARNEIIFLSDQDDFWVNGRKEMMIKGLINSGAILVSSNFTPLNKVRSNEGMPLYPLKAKDSKRHISNILGIIIGRRSYFGCTMAFKNDLKRIILPIPSFVEAHDLWIAMAANLLRSNLHIENVTVERRIHHNNLTKTDRALVKKLVTRIVFLKSMIVLYLRNKRSAQIC